MFMLLLALLIVAFLVHISRLERRTPERIAELGLLWLLVGYCRVPQIVVGTVSLVRPDQVAAILDFPAGNSFQDFMSFAYLGLAIAATLSPLYRGSYLVGPGVGWTTFWIGATWIHVRDFGGLTDVDPHALLHIFGTHGLIAVLLLVGLMVSGVVRPSVPMPAVTHTFHRRGLSGGNRVGSVERVEEERRPQPNSRSDEKV